MGRIKKKPASATLPFAATPVSGGEPAGSGVVEITPREDADVPWSKLPVATNDFGEVLYCSVCRGEQRRSPGGAVCSGQHGGADGHPMGSPEVPVVPDHVHLAIDGRPVYDGCPGCSAAAGTEQVELTPDQRHARDVGLAATAETRRQVAAMESREKSTLHVAREALDDFLGETTERVPVPSLDPKMARIIEHVFQLDAPAEYLKLVDRLSLGDERMKYRDVRFQFLDEVDRDTLMAERVLQVAKSHLSAFEIAAQERQAVFRNEAVRQLSAEKGDKNSGPRKKQITEQDVEDYCVSNWGDEWRHVEAMRARMKGATAALARLVECYMSRQASLRDICGRKE